MYGWKFKLEADHWALTFLLGPLKALSALAAARIQRFLSPYQYELVYQKGAEISNEDALSCSPCESEDNSRAWEINCLSTADGLPITFKEIGLATKNDPFFLKCCT